MQKTSLRDVTIPVTILADAPPYEEMKQFYLINNKQKRVDTDLALTLMQAMSSSASDKELANLAGTGKRYRIRAMRLVAQIAQLSSGSWFDRIEEPNISSKPGQVASIKSFVDSLRPIISTRSPVSKYADKDVLDILTSIWTGVLAMHSEWETKPERYTVQRSVGLFVIHRVARELLIPSMLSSGNRSATLVTKTLAKATGYMSRDFWRSGGQVRSYSSGGGQKLLAEEIIGEILRAGP